MRFRLYPTPEQEGALRDHCAHARFVWNLALEQANCYKPGRPTPGYAEQNRQLTEARAAEPWLAAGSIIVQQQALRDFASTKNPRERPSASTVESSTRWPPARAAHPRPILDRCRTGSPSQPPAPLARQRKDSGRWKRTKLAIARLRARESDRAKDWVEKTTTALVKENDLIAVEKLQVKRMTKSAKGTVDAPGRNVRAKAGLNREILARRWRLFLRRLKDKASLIGVDVVEVDPRNTSRRCSSCRNAALNILAAGRAVTARGGESSAPLSREPQLVGSHAA